MLVTVTEDRMGNILLDPVCGRKRREIFKGMKDNGYTGRYTDALVFLQEGMGAEEFIKDLPPRARRTLQGGWSAAVRMDEEAFLSMCKEY
jgi:hypothetical protein